MNDPQPTKPFSGYAVQFGIAPLESPAIINKKHEKLFIGIPKETSFQEKRIPLTPESVHKLVNLGHRVVIETGAGKGASFEDRDFTESGAEIVYDVKQVYEAEIIVKVAPPQPEDIDYFRFNQILISPIHLPTLQQDFMQQLMGKKVTALALEYIQDESGALPFVRSMSEIAGNAALLIAGEYLSSNKSGQGILLGGISGVPPANVVILGAGVVGELAARAAIGLGANVKVFDDNIYKLMRLQNNINYRVFTSALYPEILLHELKSADVAIGAIHSKSGRTPILVTEAMVSHMKPGSVVLDISIDQGGVFETSDVTTHQNPTFKKYDVIHYCVPNIASRFSRTASYAISNILTNRLTRASEMGGFEKLLYYDFAPRHGVYIYKGCLTNKYLSERFNIKYTNIDLLFPGRM